jgi:hypothetical protein
VRTRLSPASAHAASNASLELHILTRPSPWMPLDAASQRREARLRWNGERAVERSQQRARAARHHFRAGGCGAGSARSDLPGSGGAGAARLGSRDATLTAARGLGIGAARGSGDAPGGGAGRARGRRAEGVEVQRGAGGGGHLIRLGVDERACGAWRGADACRGGSGEARFERTNGGGSGACGGS